MKKFFSVVFSFALFLPAVPVAHAMDCYVDPVYEYSGSGKISSAVFLRDQACVSGSVVLSTVPANASVQVIGFTDGWYRISYNGGRGWVGSQFVQTSATRTGSSWDAYESYMAQLPSVKPTAGMLNATDLGAQPFSEPLSTDTVGSRSLLKLSCLSTAGVNDPCKAVYYVGADGKRHAFPNSQVYFSWYSSFDSVMVVSASTLSQYLLGTNVTYRPGVRMVKFLTDPKVYAVGRGGVLRWMASEEIARALYGTSWNTNIDDISDTFYMNYTFGDAISSTDDYSVETEQAASATFD